MDSLRQPMADGAQLGDAFETAEGLFDDVLVEIERKHFVLGQRASAEDAGVAIELLDLRQLGWKQAASAIKEPLQPRLNGLVLSHEFLSVENFIAARLADIAL